MMMPMMMMLIDDDDDDDDEKADNDVLMGRMLLVIMPMMLPIFIKMMMLLLVLGLPPVTSPILLHRCVPFVLSSPAFVHPPGTQVCNAMASGRNMCHPAPQFAEKRETRVCSRDGGAPYSGVKETS